MDSILLPNISVTAGKTVNREAVMVMVVTEFSNPFQFSYQCMDRNG